MCGLWATGSQEVLWAESVAERKRRQLSLSWLQEWRIGRNQNEIEETDRNSNENVEVPSMPSGRCDACRGFRKRNQGVCCTGCHKLVHLKCAFVTRALRETTDRLSLIHI